MDITNFVEKAVNLNVNWKHFDFYDITEMLSKNYIVNYEVNEEKIATIQIENELVGFLCMDYPLFFIEDKKLSEIKILLQEYLYIQYIPVDSINNQYLSVDKALYDKYFDYMDNINSFSANDFYFNNIT
jgi:hypothetical protein